MDDLGWAYGTRATLRNCGSPINNTPGGMAYYADNQPVDENIYGNTKMNRCSFAVERERLQSDKRNLLVGGFGSHHPGGMHVLLVDGSVTFLSENMAPATYKQLGDRADHQLLEDF